jgi:hypothetical protein
MIRPKSQNYKIGHDGILSIGNFIFYFFSCPVTDQHPKNVLPISVSTWNFLFISFCRVFFNMGNLYLLHSFLLAFYAVWENISFAAGKIEKKLPIFTNLNLFLNN